VPREFAARIAPQRALAEHHGEAELIRRVKEFPLPIGPESGQCLKILIKATSSQCILEGGTSYGYSTVWLAEAARNRRQGGDSRMGCR
jgi:predicted O-methyltransferase YrrM